MASPEEMYCLWLLPASPAWSRIPSSLLAGKRAAPPPQGQGWQHPHHSHWTASQPDTRPAPQGGDCRFLRAPAIGTLSLCLANLGLAMAVTGSARSPQSVGSMSWIWCLLVNTVLATLYTSGNIYALRSHTERISFYQK